MTSLNRVQEVQLLELVQIIMISDLGRGTNGGERQGTLASKYIALQGFATKGPEI